MNDKDAFTKHCDEAIKAILAAKLCNQLMSYTGTMKELQKAKQALAKARTVVRKF